MFRFASLLLMLSVTALEVQAQEVEDEEEQDPTDLSRYDVLGEENELLTLDELGQLETEARAAVDSGDCDEALDLLVRWSEAANMSANLVGQALEPFYDASSDDQDRIFSNRALTDELVAAEEFANGLRAERNEAWVMEAKCLLEMGEREEAVTRLYRALDYISGTDQPRVWTEARTLLWNEVGYSAN